MITAFLSNIDSAVLKQLPLFRAKFVKLKDKNCINTSNLYHLTKIAGLRFFLGKDINRPFKPLTH